MDKSLQQQLSGYFEQLTIAEQQSVLQLVKTIAEEKSHTWQEEYNQEIDDAMAEIENGKFYTHEEALAILKDRK
jgi:predicted transcriptional regulator